jgi:hypothetical protein
LGIDHSSDSGLLVALGIIPPQMTIDGDII